MNPTVVILLSDKRSGSTIFQKEICSHPQIRTVDYSPHRYLETQHWMKAASILDMPRQTYYGHNIYPAFKNKTNARALLIDEIKKNVPEFVIPGCNRELVFQGWEAVCQKFAQPVFFEKSPQHLAQWSNLSLLLEWIQQTDYRVKIIGLVRNPVSVLYSAYELFKTPPESRQYGWADMYRNLMAFEQMLPAGDFKLVKYENMIHRPQATFDEIFDFVGVEPHALSDSQVHTKSDHRWTDDPTFTLQLHEVVKQVGRHYGYTDTEMYNPPKPGLPASQRLIKNFMDSAMSVRHRLVERTIKPLLLRRSQKNVRRDDSGSTDN